jgi:pimeloyl-ACP methyl ester carboxylesterase
MPALVISGGRDLAYNHTVASELKRRLPDVAALDLPAASHMANMEDAGAVNHALSAFAERVWDGSL